MDNYCYGQRLNILATAFANAIADGLSEEEILVMSTFLMTVGDALAKIPATNAYCDKICKKKDEI